MAKQAVALRLLPETLARVDALAKVRGSSRQVVLEAAVDSFLDDSERGVPDLPPASVAPTDSTPAAARAEHARNIAARQRLLNDAKVRASR